MAYGNKYRLKFTNNLGEDYSLFFYKKNYVGDALFLTGTAEALVIRSFNSDDDRFAPILSKEANISINIEQDKNISITDFLAVEDDDWNVVIYRDLSQPAIFNGYLVVEDSSQPLLDRPYQLKLRASDGLPLLKNVPLKKSDGTEFKGLYNITDYIGHILYYINPLITFRVYSDVFHTSMDTDLCPLEQMQLDAKTFEKDEITFQDCYTVLETILRDLQCRLFFENGYWHIISMWQYRKNYGFNWWAFSIVANVVTEYMRLENEVLIARVGKTEVIKAINKDALIYYKVANKSVKKTFNYDLPKELICNQALRTVTLIPSLGGTGYDAFALDCWTHQLQAVTSGPPNPVHTAYIRNEYDTFNYHKDKFIVLPSETGNYQDAHLLSSQFDVDKGDLVSFSVDVRAKSNYSTTSDPSTNITHTAYRVFLRGDDGTFWYPGPIPPSTDLVWIQATSELTMFGGAVFTPASKTDWTTVQYGPPKVPVSGKIQLVLVTFTRVELPNESWFKNIQINYQPYIQGSTRPVLSDVNFYEQNSKINKTIEETVSISDSPKKILKGAIFVNHLLATPQWFRTGFTESLRFTQIMVLIKYNFSFKQFRKIEGTLKGLSLFNTSLVNIPCGFLPQYSFSDLPTSSLLYILTSCDINYVTGQWRGVLVEVQINGSETYDKYDFTYLFQ